MVGLVAWLAFMGAMSISHIVGGSPPDAAAIIAYGAGLTGIIGQFSAANMMQKRAAK